MSQSRLFIPIGTAFLTDGGWYTHQAHPLQQQQQIERESESVLSRGLIRLST